METIRTPLTELFGIKYPILLAGMNVAAGPKLAAAVTNAGGLGVIGGVGYTPKMLQKNIDLLKQGLNDPKTPFGVDLLLPQVGGSARKTNKDYTGGALPELIDIIINSGAKLFVSAVGVPPRWAVDKLHAAGIPVMNMVGAPKHVEKALEAGVDIICAQGGEGGGHTGDVATSILLPMVVDIVRGRKSPLNGQPIRVVGAGGIFDGRGVAMALSLGCDAVWIGTRFVCAVEAGAPKRHKDAVLKAGVHDTERTLIYTGRPLRVFATPYVKDWNNVRQAEMKAILEKGQIPVAKDVMEHQDKEELTFEKQMDMTMPLLMGQVAGAVNDVLPAKVIVETMMAEAISILKTRYQAISKL
jgi:NAD(P)H-dependent flavin oxidoreductase YrpB (nitropropane dioxygenase family)